MLSQHYDLYSAWQLKELFNEFRNCKNFKNGRKILTEWILTAQEADLPEFEECTTAFLNWFDPILNSLDYPYTNAFTEVLTTKLKSLNVTLTVSEILTDSVTESPSLLHLTKNFSSSEYSDEERKTLLN